jgi:hypothetical protein
MTLRERFYLLFCVASGSIKLVTTVTERMRPKCRVLFSPVVIVQKEKWLCCLGNLQDAPSCETLR